MAYYGGLGQDYYAGSGEPPGTWWGEGAALLGLSGPVDKEAFTNLLRGYSADGEGKLVQNAGTPRRRAGFDLTYSVPKSVSVLWSHGDIKLRLQIEKACHAALAETLLAFEELCGQTRRGRNGGTLERAGLIGAIFRHDTSRGVPGQVPDPNLHFHVVLCNAVTRPDGTTGALDAKPLFTKHMKMALGALFRTSLSKELSELGFSSSRPVRNKKQVSWFELDVVPNKLIEFFSKRRKEIEGWLKKQGLRGAKAAEAAALRTRAKKTRLHRGALLRAWQKVGAAFGFGKKQIEEHLAARNDREEPVPTASLVLEQAVKRIEENEAYFSRAMLVRYAAEQSQCLGIGAGKVLEAATAILRESKEIVCLNPAAPSETYYATKSMLELETRLLRTAEGGRGTVLQGVSDDGIAKALSKYPSIRPEQAEAVRHITEPRDSIAIVNGFAGTGKTFMLSVAHEAWRAAGYNVLGTSLAAKAASTLEAESGINSVHVSRLLWELEQGRRSIRPNTVLVLDEAGMVGTRQLERLVSLCRNSNSKLVLVGDRRQLQPIDAGAPFAALARRLGHVEMKEIIRQRDAWARKAVLDVAFGRAETALESFARQGLLTIKEERDDALLALVADWSSVAAKQPEGTLIFAGTRLEVRMLNRSCQEKRLDLGLIGKEEISIENEQFYVGDRVVFTRNNKPLGVENGRTGTVWKLDIEKQRLLIQLDTGVRLWVDPKCYQGLELGYAVTVHKAQGTTIDNGFALIGGAMLDRELAYVELSRARNETRIYSDVVSGGEHILALASRMSRSRPKQLAHDYVIEDGQ